MDSPRPRSDGLSTAMAVTILAAVLVGILVMVACETWRDAVWNERLAVSGQNLDAALSGGRQQAEPEMPLPAQAPAVSGVIAGVVALVVGRVAIWGRNIEAGARALSDRRP